MVPLGDTTEEGENGATFQGPKTIKDLGQESKGEMVNHSRQEKTDYTSPTAGFGQAGEKGVSYAVDKGHHPKDQRSSEGNTAHPHKGKCPSFPTKTTE